VDATAWFYVCVTGVIVYWMVYQLTRRSAPERKSYSPQRQRGDYGFSKLVRAGLPADIVSGVLCLAITVQSCFAMRRAADRSPDSRASECCSSGERVGFARPLPAISGAVPWTASKIAPYLIFPLGKLRDRLRALPQDRSSHRHRSRGARHRTAADSDNLLHALSTIILFVFDSGNSAATARIDLRNKPSESFMMFGFVNGVNFLAALFFGVCKGKPRMRVEAVP